MKKRLLTITAFSFLLMTSCSQLDNTDDLQKDTLAIENNLVEDFITMYQSHQNQETILNALEHQDKPISLHDFLPKLEENKATKNALLGLQQYDASIVSTQQEGGSLKATEFWMLNKNSDFNPKDVWFALSPEDIDEKDMDEITVYDIDGNTHQISALEQPAKAVIVIENNGYEALKLRVNAMNKFLKSQNFQIDRTAELGIAAEGDIEVSRLTSIHLKDDKEPWILGAAEVYAVTSGLRDDENAAQIQIIPMTYLDYKETTYNANQIMLYWDDYAYEAANIQFFEQDSNTSYKELTQNIVNTVGEQAGELSQEPWVSALSSLANVIVAALPDQWFTNDDDEVDYFYAIEKKDYTDYSGAAGNATISIKLSEIKKRN